MAIYELHTRASLEDLKEAFRQAMEHETVGAGLSRRLLGQSVEFSLSGSSADDIFGRSSSAAFEVTAIIPKARNMGRDETQIDFAVWDRGNQRFARLQTHEQLISMHTHAKRYVDRFLQIVRQSDIGAQLIKT